jgi:hypothetical protein
MARLLRSGAHADLLFTASRALLEEVEEVEEEGSIKEEEEEVPGARAVLFAAHRVIVSRIPYFAALLGGEYSDSRLLVSAATKMEVEKEVEEVEVEGRQARYEVSVDGLMMDGITLEAFRSVLHFAYTGELDLDKPLAADGEKEKGEVLMKGSSEEEEEAYLQQTMSVLVAANRLGFQVLAQLCERTLAMSLG